jgi:glucose-1-phosphate thymidylyltransferase
VAKLGDDGYISRLIEKPNNMDNRLAVVGLYYLRDGPGLMDAIDEQLAENMQTKGEYYLADALQIMLDRGLRMRVEEVEVWEDCGTTETVLHTNKYLLENGHDNSADVKADGCVILPPVNIHPSAQIKNSVIGPCATITANCQIDLSVIRESIVGEGAQIKDAVLTNSIIGQSTRVKGTFCTISVGEGSDVRL